MHYAILSDIGKKRAVNEDRAAFYIHPERSGLILAVIADGMGGHRGGDYASKTAVKLIGQQFTALSPNDVETIDWEQWLLDTIQQINYHLFDLALRNDKYQGMGTTLDVVIIDDTHCALAHVGDSRIYMIAGDHIRQLTKDHSFVNALLESGEITQEEAEHHPRKNWIVKAVGSERRTVADVASIRLSDPVTFLLCTDGLSNLLKEEEILTIIQEQQPLQMRAERLINRANALGGDDNISVILIEWWNKEVDSL